jgi:hypothetical protein
MTLRRSFAVLAGLVLGAGGCSNGAFEVAAPASPTQAPAVAATSPAPSPTATPMPTTSSATPTPTPVPSSSATAGVQCTQVDAGPFQENWTLNGSALTVTLPPYYSWQGTLAIPAQSPSGTVITEGDSQDNFISAPTSTSSDPAYAARTKDFFMSFRLSQKTTFSGAANPLLPITLASSCLASGTTYYIDTFLSGAFTYTESAVASGGSVTLNLKAAPNPFPGGLYMAAVISH